MKTFTVFVKSLQQQIKQNKTKVHNYKIFIGNNIYINIIVVYYIVKLLF